MSVIQRGIILALEISRLGKGKQTLKNMMGQDVRRKESMEILIECRTGS